MTKFLDSRHVQLAKYTVFDEESESEVKKCQIVEPGGEKSEKRTSRQQQHIKNRFRDYLKTMSTKRHFLQYFPCENHDLEVNVEISVQKSIKIRPGDQSETKINKAF